MYFDACNLFTQKTTLKNVKYINNVLQIFYLKKIKNERRIIENEAAKTCKHFFHMGNFVKLLLRAYFFCFVLFLFGSIIKNGRKMLLLNTDSGY